MSRIVIALGGNALGNTPEEQIQLVKDTAKSIVDLIEEGHEVVIGHGNGPQVGMLKNSFDDTAKQGKGPFIPLSTAVAMTQGYIGFDLQQSIKNELISRGIIKEVVTLVTQIEVSPEDQAFTNPTKPIGSFYSEEEAKKLAEEKGWTVKDDAGRGWRQVVPSPMPMDIVEKETIKTLVNSGTIVITVGGGAIPVMKENGSYKGIDAVIDKDNASELLASTVDADKLVILTAVDRVSINWGKPNQKDLDKIDVAEAKQYIDEKHFAPGSMLPKVEAAIRFVEKNPTKESLIASLEGAKDALEGKTGTIIVNKK